MAVKPVGIMSEFANSFMLDAGARSGFDSIVNFGGVGAGVGAINGAFSDYEGVFSGAMKGAVVGGLTGYGAKTLGTKYADNYYKKVSKFTGDLIDPSSENYAKKDIFGLTPSHFKNNLNEGESSFGTDKVPGQDLLKKHTQTLNAYIESLPKT